MSNYSYDEAWDRAVDRLRSDDIKEKETLQIIMDRMKNIMKWDDTAMYQINQIVTDGDTDEDLSDNDNYQILYESEIIRRPAEYNDLESDFIESISENR